MVHLKWKMRFGIVALLAAGAALRFLPAEILVFRWEPDAVRPRTYPVLNPWRDRRPEALADQVFGRMAATGGRDLPIATDEQIRSREGKYPVSSWRLGRRWDRAGECSLQYWVRRGGGYGYVEEEVFLTLRLDKGQWMVSDFSAIY